jgi:branched-chain amino acid transport system permease protein
MPVAGIYRQAAAALTSLSFEQRLACGLLVLFALLPPAVAALVGNYALLLAERATILAIAALSLELLVGTGGLLSFGHAAFLGIGAYSVGVPASHGLGTLSLALPAALAACGLFALITGAVAVRTRGVYFIMITLAFGQMAYFIAGSLAPYGGDDGLTIASRTQVAGIPLFESELAFFYATLACLALACMAVHRLVASRFGRVLRGLTDSEMRMQALGFAPYPYRLTLYVLAGTLCGLAGFLLGNQAEFVSPAYMHWQRSGELILMVLLGGTGTLYGPILGALTFTLLEEVLSRLTEHWKVILGPLLILVVLFANGGIAGAIASWRRGHLWFGLSGAARLAAKKTIARLARWRGELERGARRIGETAMVRADGIGGAISSCWRGHFGLERQRAARRTAKKTIARLARWRGELERGARRIGKTAMVRTAHGLAAAFALWRALKLAFGGFVISLRRRVDRWGR